MLTGRSERTKLGSDRAIWPSQPRRSWSLGQRPERPRNSPEAGRWFGWHPWDRRGGGAVLPHSPSPEGERPSRGPRRACCGRRPSVSRANTPRCRFAWRSEREPLAARHPRSSSLRASWRLTPTRSPSLPTRAVTTVNAVSRRSLAWEGSSEALAAPVHSCGTGVGVVGQLGLRAVVPRVAAASILPIWAARARSSGAMLLWSAVPVERRAASPRLDRTSPRRQVDGPAQFRWGRRRCRAREDDRAARWRLVLAKARTWRRRA